jgi:predicted RND superfamily exporter protein
LYKKLLDIFFKSRWFVLIIVAIIWLLAIYSAFGLKLDENIMDLLPDKDKHISTYREIYNKFNPMNAVFIDLALSSNNNDLNLLISSADSVYNALNKSPFFTKIIFRWQIQDLRQALNILTKYRCVLFSRQDSIDIQNKLNESYIRERIQQWKRALMETPSPFLAEQFIKDPLDFNNILQKKLSSSQIGNENITIYQGRFFNKGKNRILIIAQPKFKSTDTGNGRKLIEFLGSQFKKLENNTQNRIAVSYISAHRFSIENANRIQSDIQNTVSLALVAIIILTLLVYSRPLLMILTLLPALFGTAISLGLIRWFDSTISAIIIGSGAMLIGITVDYGIHFLYHLDQASSTGAGDSGRNVINQLLRPLLLSAGTTIIAFIALQFSGLPGYRQLSWFVILGIFGALVFVILILPLLVNHSSKIKKAILPVQKLFLILFKFIHNNRIPVLVTLIVLTILAIPGFMRLKFDGDVQNLNAVSAEIRTDIQKFKSEYGNILSSTYLMVKADNIDSALYKTELINQKIEDKYSSQQVRLSREVISLLPSVQKQNENRRRWKKLFNDGQVQRLSLILRNAAHDSGLKEDVFDLFINNLQSESGYITYEKYNGILLESILSSVIHLDSDKAYIFSNIQFNSDKELNTLSQIIKDLHANAFIYDGKSFVTQIVDLILLELERIGVIAFIFVLIFISFSVHNFKSILIIVAPLLISIFWTFSILGWLGIKINIINSIISVFIFGLVIDYSIFLVSSFKNKQSNFSHTSGGAILISALTTMIGLGALVFAGHPALHSLGLTALIGISSGLIAVIFFVPVVLYKK